MIGIGPVSAYTSHELFMSSLDNFLWAVDTHSLGTDSLDHITSRCPHVHFCSHFYSKLALVFCFKSTDFRSPNVEDLGEFTF